MRKVFSCHVFGFFEGMPFRLILGTEPAATGTGPVFVFETDASRLWFDEDGIGGAESPVLIATLDNVTTLAQSCATPA